MAHRQPRRAATQSKETRNSAAAQSVVVRKSMKRMLGWCLVGGGLYLASGLLFPVSLWYEFGGAGYGSQLPDGSTKLAGGFVDYARLYPHIVLYPLCWFLFATANLAAALHAISKHADSASRPRLWRISLYLPLALFAVIACLGAIFEGRNQNMMLFEISAAAQKEPVTSATNDIPEKFQHYSIADIALLPILSPNPQQKSDKVTELRTAEASLARQKIFGWDDTWDKQQDRLSFSRPLYLLTFAGMVWAMFSLLLCCGLVAAIPQDRPERLQGSLATIGAIVAIFLWLPHRIYYNAGTKAVLFPPDKTDIFNFWIPNTLSERGITGTEAVPLFFLLIAVFFISVVIFKISDTTVNRVMLVLNVFGFVGALILSSLDPKSFGIAVGLNGNWTRFTVVSCLLLVLFIVYFVYAVNQGEASSAQRSKEDSAPAKPKP
jgi:hypothetical protein